MSNLNEITRRHGFAVGRVGLERIRKFDEDQILTYAFISVDATEFLMQQKVITDCVVAYRVSEDEHEEMIDNLVTFIREHPRCFKVSIAGGDQIYFVEAPGNSQKAMMKNLCRKLATDTEFRKGFVEACGDSDGDEILYEH